MNSEVSLIRGDTFVTVSYPDGEVYTVYHTQPHFDEVVAAVKKRDWDTVRNLSSPADMIKNRTGGLVEVIDGEVVYKGTPIHNMLTSRILDMLENGLNIDPLVTFMEALMENPSEKAQNELYNFLDYGKLPITDDGHFLAYKRIKEDWKDCHSGTIDNSVGQVVEMDREGVTEDSNITCSSGLHFCSREYLSSFYGSRLIVVKIHPRDVVSIPNDYNNTKGRCCRYEVLTEIMKDEQLEDLLLVSPAEEDITLEDVAVVNFNNPDKDDQLWNEPQVEETNEENDSLNKSFLGNRWLAGIRRRFFKR